MSYGSAMEDVSYFLGSSMVPDERRRCEKDLLRKYLAQLNGEDEEKLGWDQAWLQIRRGACFGLLQAVYAAILCIVSNQHLSQQLLTLI